MIKLLTNLDKVLPDKAGTEKALRAGLEAYQIEFTNQVGKGFEQERQPGGPAWKPLSPRYAEAKKRRFGNQKILFRTGKLKQAALNPGIKFGASQDSGQSGGAGNSEAAMELEITIQGVPYAKYHQQGTNKLPARVFFTIKGPAKAAATKAFNKAFKKAAFE